MHVCVTPVNNEFMANLISFTCWPIYPYIKLFLSKSQNLCCYYASISTCISKRSSDFEYLHNVGSLSLYLAIYTLPGGCFYNRELKYALEELLGDSSWWCTISTAHVSITQIFLASSGTVWQTWTIQFLFCF